MSHPLYKTVLCRYYPNCKRADQCSFAHGEKDLRGKKKKVQKILQPQQPRPQPMYFEAFDTLAPKFGDLMQYACTQRCGYCPNQDILFSRKTIKGLIPTDVLRSKEITTNIVASSQIPITIQTESGQVISTITIDLKKELTSAVKKYLHTPAYEAALDKVAREQLTGFDITEYESEGTDWLQKIIPCSTDQPKPDENYFRGVCCGLEPEIHTCKLFPCGPSPNPIHTAFSEAYWMPIPTANVLRYLWFKYPEFVIGKPADPRWHGN